MKHPCQIFVEHELGSVSEAQLIEWACDVLSTDGPLADDLTVAELAGLGPQIQSDLDLASRYFRSIIQRHFPDFTFQSPMAVGGHARHSGRGATTTFSGALHPTSFAASFRRSSSISIIRVG